MKHGTSKGGKRRECDLDNDEGWRGNDASLEIVMTRGDPALGE